MCDVHNSLMKNKHVYQVESGNCSARFKNQSGKERKLIERDTQKERDRDSERERERESERERKEREREREREREGHLQVIVKASQL